ncbi:hypothetical protein ACT3OH_03080 [Vreelandella zhanjiangensis]|uniref:hypothetical protein n=1 Tax=Vreelandella zhanjiangensis TaxID=1121960 RepID=UPI00402AD505
MKRIPPDQKEVTLYVTYFWDKLKAHSLAAASVPAPPSQTKEFVNLAKQPAYIARRELLSIKTSADLMGWADVWVTMEDWRKARDTVRSWRYKARNQLVRASMRENTKTLLDERAQSYNLSLWRYLESLDLTEEKLAALEAQSEILKSLST